MKCKLCGSKRMVKLNTIYANEIKLAYKMNFKIDVSKFFVSDVVYLYKCLDCDIKSFYGVRPGDSDFYDYLQEFPMYYESDKPEFRQALNYIAKYNPSKILEIGAGKGFFLEKLKNTFEVRASELSKKSMEVLKEKGISLDTEQDTYDFICSFQVVEHIDNLGDLLSFIDKKLRVGGLLFISVPNNDSPYFQETFDVLDYPPHHLHQFSKKALLSIGNILKYELIDYWVEPMRIEHFVSIIRHRRKKIMNRFKFISKAFSLVDYFLIPYIYNFYKDVIPGHTHGALFKKI